MWGSNSTRVLVTLDPRLQEWVTRVRDEVTDISLLAGYRSEEVQNQLYDSGMSKLRYPRSKHNTYPSLAVDLQPYPRPSKETKLWGALGYIAGRGEWIANDMGIVLRWGGDWDMDGDLTNQSFDDLFHWEIYNAEIQEADNGDDSRSDSS